MFTRTAILATLACMLTGVARAEAVAPVATTVFDTGGKLWRVISRKDWVDVEAMLEAGASIDVAEVLRWVGRIAGDTDPRYNRVAAVLTR